MNLLQRTLIEKAGYENGFENSIPDEHHGVCLSSARHGAKVIIQSLDTGEKLSVSVDSIHTQALFGELARSFPDIESNGQHFLLPSFSILALFLRRASALAQSLPNQAVSEFQKDFAEAVAALPDPLRGTEAERLMKQRIGQTHFRNALLDYWGNACAVTGITVLEVLRASHAKPWAECSTDAERLDVFNGFLLCANLDALFDRFLISFDENGRLLISKSVQQEDRERLNLNQPLTLRWLTPHHQRYLTFHRDLFFSKSSS